MLRSVPGLGAQEGDRLLAKETFAMNPIEDVHIGAPHEVDLNVGAARTLEVCGLGFRLRYYLQCLRCDSGRAA